MPKYHHKILAHISRQHGLRAIQISNASALPEPQPPNPTLQRPQRVPCQRNARAQTAVPTLPAAQRCSHQRTPRAQPPVPSLQASRRRPYRRNARAELAPSSTSNVSDVPRARSAARLQREQALLVGRTSVRKGVYDV